MMVNFQCGAVQMFVNIIIISISKTIQHEYVLANIAFDTAEIELSKVIISSVLIPNILKYKYSM